jgi:hypothetical protein
VIATGRIMQTVISGSIQSNRDRAEFVALGGAVTATTPAD